MEVADTNTEDRLEDQAAASLVKARDLDRYWAALFAPAPARPALLALYAFNAELARIPFIASEPMPGEIRLQWWRDALDRAAPGIKTGHPIADSFARAVMHYNFPRDRLIRMIDAYAPSLYGDLPADIPALNAYLQDTSGTIFELAALILAGRGSKRTEAAAEQAGLAFGLTHLLSTLPQQVANRRLSLPLSLLESKGVDLAGLFRGENSKSLGLALMDLRNIAHRALTGFDTIAPGVDKDIWAAFLPLAVVEPYLKAMAANSRNPLRDATRVNPMVRFVRIWRAATRRRL